MGFAEAYAAVEQQGVEGGEARFFGHGVTGRAGQTVAVALDEVLQRVVGAQLRADAGLLDAGNDKGIGYLARVIFINVDGQVDEGILHGCAAVGGQGSAEEVVGDGLVHDDAVFQHGIGAQLHADDSLQQVDIVVFNIFIEERTRHLDQQGAAFDFQRHDGDEPHFEGLLVLRTQGVFYHFEAFCPYSFIIFLYHFRITMLHFQ